MLCRYTYIKEISAMIVTFCGHSQFHRTEEYKQKILAFLEEKIGDKFADMYLGGYGGFDDFAYDCCKKCKETHPNISICAKYK